MWSGLAPAARAVPLFRPLTLKPDENVYLVLEYAIACGRIPANGSLGGADIRYETLGISRTKGVASVSNKPEFAPARIACS
jgi:hypothetical protein